MWVLIALIALCAVLILLLAVPLELSFRYRSGERPPSGLKLVWFFGLLSTRLASKKKADGNMKPAAAGQESKTSKDRTDMRFFISILRVKGLLAHLKRFVCGLLSCVKIKRLSADFAVSFDSPADTGYLFAFSVPFNYIMHTSTPWNITITPRFYDEAYCEAAIDGTVRLVPVTFLKPLTRFIFALPFLRAVAILVKEWKRKG